MVNMIWQLRVGLAALNGQKKRFPLKLSILSRTPWKIRPINAQRLLVHNVLIFWPQDKTNRLLTKTTRQETGYVDDSNAEECDGSRRSWELKLYRRSVSDSSLFIPLIKNNKTLHVN